jgi:hypothetical protein
VFPAGFSIVVLRVWQIAVGKNNDRKSPQRLDVIRAATDTKFSSAAAVGRCY